jgi:hypothetical protein
MVLLSWERVDKGALIGRAAVRLPNGLEIAGIGIFQKDGAAWAQLPSEPMRNTGGEVLKDERGKVRYRSPLKWSSRRLQEAWSATLIDLITTAHGSIGGGQ